MSTVADLEEELATAEEDLAAFQDGIALGAADDETFQYIPQLQATIASLKSKIAAKNPPPPPPNDAPPPPPKYDMSKHPKLRKDSPEAQTPRPEDERLAFKTGDTVMAKWSVDRSWWPATIMAKTGSSTDPVYTVKYTGFPDKETKRKHEVRAAEKKRKAEAPLTATTASNAAPAPAPPPISPAPTQNGAVISAAPSIDPTLVQKREPSKVSDGPTRMAPAPKKLKGSKTLQKAKDSWTDFQKAGPKKPGFSGISKKPKDSQFRTPDLPNAKVGFTGSGKPMSKDPTRQKWNYAQDQLDAD